ncbi:MAG TPA: branched-chain amino acid transaminase, partial [Actinomycetota bacterium]
MSEKVGFSPRGMAYMDGRYLPFEEAKVSIATHAFNYGTGCFEGIRGYWNAERGEIFVVRLLEHFRRMARSAHMLRIALPKSPEELAEIGLELIRRGDYREDVYIRPIAYKASPVIKVGLIGLEDAFCCYTAPMGAYHDIEKGLAVTVSGWRRIDDNVIPARGKVTGGYVNAALAIADAQQGGYDEAILLTSDGHVSEGSSCNIFLAMEGALVTPAVTDDILVGITRSAIIELARTLGLETVERKVDRTELFVADEIFLVGTGVQVAPVTSVDGRTVGHGKIGEITRSIQDLYLSAVHGEV